MRKALWLMAVPVIVGALVVWYWFSTPVEAPSTSPAVREPKEIGQQFRKPATRDDLYLHEQPPLVTSEVVQSQLTSLIGEAHPELPDSTKRIVSACVIARLEQFLDLRDPRTQEQVSASLRSVQAEMRNLPFGKSVEGLQYGRDYLVHRAEYWAAILQSLADMRAEIRPSDAIQQAGLILRPAINQLCRSEDNDPSVLFDQVSTGMNNSQNCWFVPEYKFVLSEQQASTLASNLADQIKQAKNRIAQRTAKIPDPKIRNSVRCRLIEDEARRLQSSVQKCYQKNLPEAFWRNIHLSPEFSQQSSRLSERSVALFAQEIKTAAEASRDDQFKTDMEIESTRIMRDANDAAINSFGR